MTSFTAYEELYEKMRENTKLPVFFHKDQLKFKPLYEWAFGKRIKHPETTKRAESILGAVEKARGEFEILTPLPVSSRLLTELHSYQLLTLYNTTNLLSEGTTFYPTVFPNKDIADADPTNIYHSGYFCFDSGTPLNSQTLSAASWSASCAHDAAHLVAAGICKAAYALSRPPGHHASESLFGGYCYFNNAAIAAQVLRKHGRVAILDIDFHHGNGTQDLFYHSKEVLTLSIHGDPRTCYPYFSGFSHETGSGPGKGYNLNFPLPKGTTYDLYRQILVKQALRDLQHFDPDYLIIAAGFDTYKLDPVGDFQLETADYYSLGEILGALPYPKVVIQEGGYYTPDLGKNVVSFLKGLVATAQTKN